jgi:hypothetical protein
VESSQALLSAEVDLYGAAESTEWTVAFTTQKQIPYLAAQNATLQRAYFPPMNSLNYVD